MKKILVIGAGSWGTAIANLLAKNSHQVFLSANDLKVVEEINKQKTNKKFLPTLKLSDSILAINGFEEIISSVDFVFIVVPSAATTEVFKKISILNPKKTCSFVICSKGIEPRSLTFLGDAFCKITKIKKYAILSGPNFASEVAEDVPTITTVASKDKKVAASIIKIVGNEHFRAIYSAHPRTAEICGVMKNIIAIGCGIVDGLSLGVNAKSALVIKGISEIEILCKKLKTSDCISNAAGFGDIFLTCSSEKSRNNALGLMLSHGKNYLEIVHRTGKTYEGASSVKFLIMLAKKLKLRLDLCEAINEILANKSSSKEIREIISKVILK